MKNFKMTRGIKIILVTLLVLAVGTLIAVMFLNNKTIQSSLVSGGDGRELFSAEIAPEGGSTDSGDEDDSGDSTTHEHTYTSKWISNGDGTHYKKWSCGSCESGWNESAKSCSLNYVNAGSLTHRGTCAVCNYSTTESCSLSGYTNNGETHSRLCSICGTTYSSSHTYDGLTCRCSVCNAETHEYEDVYVDNHNGTHTYTSECTKCNLTSSPMIEDCDYVDGVCACGAYTDEHKHVWGEKGCLDLGDGRHRYYNDCLVCGLRGYLDIYEHTFENGICKYCGATDGTGDSEDDGNGNPGGGSSSGGGSSDSGSTEGGDSGDTECEHDYEIESDDNNHWEECSKCNDKKTAEAHQYETYTDKEDGTHISKCTVCEHELTENHVMGTCVDNEDGTHSTKCTKCDYEEKEAHTMGDCIDNENGTHSATCTKCDYKLTEEHEYDEDGECVDCGAIKPSEECEHIYEMENDDTHHWEECTKCGEMKKGTLEEHIYTDYVDNEDGTHSATCTKCEYKLTEEHDYDKEGECVDCGAIKPLEECEHNYEIKNDEKQHWEECAKCEEIKEGTLEDHIYTKYIDNGDGTHSATCTKCEYKLTEKHKFNEEGKCEDCGAKEPKDNVNVDDDNDKDNNKDNNNNSSNESSNANIDDSTANNEIPKAGSQSAIFVVAVALGVVAIVAMIKLKKYKNI